MTHLDDLMTILISLERSQERRNSMSERLNRLNLTWTWMPAVDGRLEIARLLSSIDPILFKQLNGRDYLVGEIGCYHSHLKTWEMFTQSDKKHLLVLEDDVVFHEDFLSALQCALEHSNDWDYLKLNKIRAKQPMLQKRIGSYSINAYFGPATGTGAYLINRDTASKLQKSMLPIVRPVDHELDRVHAHDFRHFGLEPFPSHIDEDKESTITAGQPSFNKLPRLKRLRSIQASFVNNLKRFIYLYRNKRVRFL